MIKSIRVDGFKSLNQFHLDLNPGLNILIGPNGAGKSNIVQFFEFLSNLIRFDVAESLSRAGGAGSILTKIDENAYRGSIKSTIQGTEKISSRKILSYQFYFEIELSPEKDIIYYKNQEIKIVVSSKVIEDIEKLTEKELDLHVKQTATSFSNINLNILRMDKRIFKIPFFLQSRDPKSGQKKEIKEYMIRYDLALNSLLNPIMRLSDYTSFIYADMRGGEIFNIIPSKVNEVEDIARAPGIRKDGSGLASTLYALQKGKTIKKHSRFLLRAREFEKPIIQGKDTLNIIIKNVKLANSTITNLKVANDTFSNKLNIKVYIKEEGKDVALPLSAMSDGTIKWLTLITALFTSRSIFSVEEPENYLHPWMQKEIVNIMRDAIKKKGDDSFIIMTTHSESLLNCANPEEIIVVSMEDGKTLAKRVKNSKLLKEEISKTGFGLGYYYLADALENE